MEVVDLNPPATSRFDPDVESAVAEALILLAQDRQADAIAAVERVIRLLPGTPLASHLTGLVSLRVGEIGRGLEALTNAHESAPETAEHSAVLGIVHAKLGHVVDSLYFRKLTTAATHRLGIPGLVPDWLGDFAELFYTMQEQPLITRANKALAAGHVMDALREFRRATEVDPRSEPGWRGLIETNRQLGRVRDAAVASAALLGCGATTTGDFLRHGELLAELGEIDAALTLQRQTARIVPDDSWTASAPLRTLCRRTDPDDGELAEAARDFGCRFTPVYSRRMVRAAKAGTAIPKGPIRLGLLSGRWRPGQGLDGLVPVIEKLDKSKVSICAYALNPGDLPLARRLRAIAASWVAIDGLDNETLDTIVCNDAPDILIDLDGPGWCAWPILLLARPAPRILTLWAPSSAVAPLGYDGIFVSGAGGATTLPSDLAPLSGPRPRRRHDGLVFGTVASEPCFDADIVESWRSVFARVPRARLLLDQAHLGGEAAAHDLARAFEDDIAIEIHEGGKAGDDYLDRVDLLLEPPGNAAPGAALRALGQGIPVVACRSAQPRAAELTDFLEAMLPGRLVGGDLADFIARAVAASVAENWNGLAEALYRSIARERASGAARQARAWEEALAGWIERAP